MTKGINRLNTDSIQSIDDVKTWARNHEIRMDSRVEQMQAAIFENKVGIARNWKWLMIAISWFGCVLVVVVLTSGTYQIIQRLFQ